MGASIALQTAAIDHRIDGVIAECPFSSLRNVCYDYVRWQVKGVPDFMVDAALAKAESVAAFDADAVAPENMVADIECPVLLLHGTNDERIPYVHAERIAARFRHVNQRLVPVHGAKHMTIAETLGIRYPTMIGDFLDLVR